MEQLSPRRRRQHGRGRAPAPAPARGRGRMRGPAKRDGHVQENQIPQGVEQEGLAQQVLAGLTQLVNQAPRRAQDVLDPFTAAYQEFQKHQAPRFDSSEGYDAPDTWLQEVQRILFHAHIAVEHWAELAATCFDKDARHWWATQRSQYQGDGPGISWEWFTDVFRARFMSATQWEGYRRTLETLVQGNMTARQYGETFHLFPAMLQIW